MIVLRIKIWLNQNQFWKGYKIWVFNIKIIFIIILLLQLCYIPNYIKILLPGAPCIKNLDGMIIMLVPREKKQKACLCYQWNWNAFYQSNYKQKHAFSNIIQKAVDNNLLEEKTEYLICDRSNDSVKIFTAHSTTVWPTPPLHDPHQPCMTHPILMGGPFW